MCEFCKKTAIIQNEINELADALNHHINLGAQAIAKDNHEVAEQRMKDAHEQVSGIIQKMGEIKKLRRQMLDQHGPEKQMIN